MPEKALLHIRLGEVNTLPYRNVLAEKMKSQNPNRLFTELDNHVESWLISKSLELMEEANQIIVVIENFGIENGVRPFLNLLKSLSENGKLKSIYLINDSSTSQYLAGFFEEVELVEIENLEEVFKFLEN